MAIETVYQELQKQLVCVDSIIANYHHDDIFSDFAMMRRNRPPVSVICQGDNPMAQRVLLFQYINGKSWKEIISVTGCCRSRVFQFRDTGLGEIARILPSA